MTNGNDGMSYSLPSRDLIANSIENVVGAQWYDGVIAVVGCDKNMPGLLDGLSPPQSSRNAGLWSNHQNSENTKDKIGLSRPLKP